MADEQKSDAVASEQPVTEAAQTSEVAPLTPSPEVPAQTPAKVNLYELDDFKRYQATVTKQINDARQQAVNAQRAADDLRMAGMDDVQRIQFQYQRDVGERDAYIKALQEEKQLTEMQLQKQRDLAELSREADVPIEELMEAETYDDAVKRALRYNRTKATAKAQTREEKLARNSVDVGGGNLSTPTTRAQTEAKEHLRSGNTKDYLKLLLSGELD